MTDPEFAGCVYSYARCYPVLFHPYQCLLLQKHVVYDQRIEWGLQMALLTDLRERHFDRTEVV